MKLILVCQLLAFFSSFSPSAYLFLPRCSNVVKPTILSLLQSAVARKGDTIKMVKKGPDVQFLSNNNGSEFWLQFSGERSHHELCSLLSISYGVLVLHNSNLYFIDFTGKTNFVRCVAIV